MKMLDSVTTIMSSIFERLRLSIYATGIHVRHYCDINDVSLKNKSLNRVFPYMAAINGYGRKMP